MLSAIIIDDERDARQVLKDKISIHCPQVDVIFDSDDLQECAAAIKSKQPDIIFLDIQMPEMDGFEFLETIRGFDGEVIFVTAYDQYALQAFEVYAFGYLLKPIGTEKLKDLIAQVEKRKQSSDYNSEMSKRIDALLESNKNEIKKLAVPVANGYNFLSMQEIIRCEGAAKYTVIHHSQGKVVSTRNIGYFVNILAKYNFFASHKSHLVNFRYVDKYTSDGEIVLKNGNRVPLSRRRKMLFLDSFV